MKIIRVICVVLFLTLALSLVSSILEFNEQRVNVSGGQSSTKPTPPVDDNGNDQPEPSEPDEPSEPNEECYHSYSNVGNECVCSLCGKVSAHSFAVGECAVCGYVCEHNSYADGVCVYCREKCSHSYSNGVCIVCGAQLINIEGFSATLPSSNRAISNEVGTEISTTATASAITVTQSKFNPELSYVHHVNNGVFFIEVHADFDEGEEFTFSFDVQITKNLGNDDCIAVIVNDGTVVRGGIILVTSPCFRVVLNGTWSGERPLEYFGIRLGGKSAEFSNFMLERGHTDGVWVDCGTIVTPETPNEPDEPSEPDEECSHTYHNGVCVYCREECSHSYADGVCTTCGEECSHSYSNGTCTTCGSVCSHSYTNGVCTLCGKECPHERGDDTCDYCGSFVAPDMCLVHSYTDGVCSECGKECTHSYTDGVCTTCGEECSHTYSNGFCTECGMECSHTYSSGLCTKCGHSKPIQV